MERDDIELIQRTLSGDETAFSDLVKKYQKSVHALAWRKIKDFHIAEEITQDTFLHVYEKLSTLREPARFAGWLYVIASRRCIAWQRKQKRVAQSMETVSDEILEKTAYANYVSEQREETAAEHRRQVVESLLEKLPESERTVMILHYLGEMSCERISKFLGVSVNTVKSRLSRARNRLRADDSIIRRNPRWYFVKSESIRKHHAECCHTEANPLAVEQTGTVGSFSFVSCFSHFADRCEQSILHPFSTAV